MPLQLKNNCRGISLNEYKNSSLQKIRYLKVKEVKL